MGTKKAGISEKYRDYPHVFKAFQYMEMILKKEIPACRWVILACKRNMNDLKKVRLSSYPYKFDPERAEEVCNFVENFPHVEGEAARGRYEDVRFILEPWQCFIDVVVFGWVHKKTELRRFREAYIQVPRKNGKSTMSATIGHYMFVADGEYSAEVYSGATTEAQAWEIYLPARLMALRAPDFMEHFGVDVFAKSMCRPDDMSRFAPIIGDPGDGASPSCALIDEFHEHATSGLYDTMVTGMGARSQPLSWIITTAGENVDGPCFMKFEDCCKILQGTYEGDEIFCIMYGIDKKDKWNDPSSLRKANPNYGVSVKEDFLLSQLKLARQSPDRQNSFRMKHLNEWVSAKAAFYNLLHVAKCERKTLKMSDFAGEDCVVAVDLASKIDLTAVVTIFKRQRDDGKFDYFFFQKFYIPEDTVNEDGNDHYRAWVNEGYLCTTPGSMIDYSFIEEDVKKIAENHNITEFCFDPWNAAQTGMRMQDEGMTAVEIRQTVQNLSEPMKQSEGLFKSGRLFYDGNPVMRWCLSNVVAKKDAKDNYYPCKSRDKNKIDGAVALLIGLNRAIVEDGTAEPSITVC